MSTSCRPAPVAACRRPHQSLSTSEGCIGRRSDIVICCYVCPRARCSLESREPGSQAHSPQARNAVKEASKRHSMYAMPFAPAEEPYPPQHTACTSGTVLSITCRHRTQLHFTRRQYSLTCGTLVPPCRSLHPPCKSNPCRLPQQTENSQSSESHARPPALPHCGRARLR